MVEVVANSVAWSGRVFSSSIARRTCNSVDEFNRGTSLVILKKRAKFLIKKGSNDEKKGPKNGKNGKTYHYLLLFSIIWLLFPSKFSFLGFDGKKGADDQKKDAKRKNTIAILWPCFFLII